LINFANDKLNSNIFIHPVVKAIIIHFWVGYLHPFCDGNGRTARALFYWYLLKNNYFGFSYIPLSKELKVSKSKYAKSYIYSEQDDLDMTYFLSYNLSKIKLALDKFKEEVKLKFKENEKNMKKLSSL
jgi:Fic family protein